MQVHQIMTREILSLPSYKSLDQAYELMVNHQMRHLLIVDHKNAVGIISMGDLLLHANFIAPGKLSFRQCMLGDVMSVNLVSCSSWQSIARVAATMLACRINCLPVVDEGELVGIVTSSDILDAICMQEELSGRKVMPLDYHEHRPEGNGVRINQ